MPVTEATRPATTIDMDKTAAASAEASVAQAGAAQPAAPAGSPVTDGIDLSKEGKPAETQNSTVAFMESVLSLFPADKATGWRKLVDLMKANQPDAPAMTSAEAAEAAAAFDNKSEHMGVLHSLAKELMGKEGTELLTGANEHLKEGDLPKAATFVLDALQDKKKMTSISEHIDKSLGDQKSSGGLLGAVGKFVEKYAEGHVGCVPVLSAVCKLVSAIKNEEAPRKVLGAAVKFVFELAVYGATDGVGMAAAKKLPGWLSGLKTWFDRLEKAKEFVGDLGWGSESAAGS